RLADAVVPRPTSEIVRIEVRLRVEREKAAGAHVDDDDRTGGVRTHRALDGLLELHVHGEAHVTTGERLLPRRGVEEALGLGAGPVSAASVDDALLPAALSSEIALPRV